VPREGPGAPPAVDARRGRRPCEAVGTRGRWARCCGGSRARGATAGVTGAALLPCGRVLQRRRARPHGHWRSPRGSWRPRGPTGRSPRVAPRRRFPPSGRRQPTRGRSRWGAAAPCGAVPPPRRSPARAPRWRVDRRRSSGGRRGGGLRVHARGPGIDRGRWAPAVCARGEQGRGGAAGRAATGAAEPGAAHACWPRRPVAATAPSRWPAGRRVPPPRPRGRAAPRPAAAGPVPARCQPASPASATGPAPAAPPAAARRPRRDGGDRARASSGHAGRGPRPGAVGPPAACSRPPRRGDHSHGAPRPVACGAPLRLGPRGRPRCHVAPAERRVCAPESRRPGAVRRVPGSGRVAPGITAADHGGRRDRQCRAGRAHGGNAPQRERAEPGAVAARAACDRGARALAAPPRRREPGVLARHHAVRPSGGDRATAGRVVPATPAACAGGLLPPDARPAGAADGAHRHRADARPRARREAAPRHGRRAPASGRRGTTRPRPEGPALDAPRQGLGRCTGRHARQDAALTVTSGEPCRGRSPVVKRQTCPRSGNLSTFCGDLLGCEVDVWDRALTAFPTASADGTCLHHTRIEVQSLSRQRWQRDVRVALCDLETYWCPRTVRLNAVAERLAFASEVQARGRGSHGNLARPSPAGTGAGAGGQSTRQAQGRRPTRS
jgi:hypothetical protein